MHVSKVLVQKHKKGFVHLNRLDSFFLFSLNYPHGGKNAQTFRLCLVQCEIVLQFPGLVSQDASDYRQSLGTPVGNKSIDCW